MGKTAQRRATANHRKRARAKGLVRLELTVPRADVAALRQLAEKLKGADQQAARFRQAMHSALKADAPKSALDIYASNLPDEYFEGVFDRKRTISNRKVEW